MAKYGKKEESTAVADPVGIEAKTVEVGTDNPYIGYDRFKMVEHIERKDPKNHYAWVLKKDARLRHFGWEYCAIESGPKAVVVKTMEEAENLTDTVLCRRSQEIQFRATELDRKKLAESNRREGIEKRKDYLASQIPKMKGLSATPLDETEFTE